MKQWRSIALMREPGRTHETGLLTMASAGAQVRALALALIIITLGANAFAQETATQGAEMPANLPVTRVVLFTNGVGYFEHEGTVTGDQVLDLVVAPNEMDDLLQSLVLQDF